MKTALATKKNGNIVLGMEITRQRTDVVDATVKNYHHRRRDSVNNVQLEFFELRKKVNEAIRHAWASGEPGKSYEGVWEVTCEYPGADEDDSEFPCAWMIVLHCYLLGPSRHYSWRGKTFEDALKKCKYNVEQWCKDEMERDEEGVDIDGMPLDYC